MKKEEKCCCGVWIWVVAILLAVSLFFNGWLLNGAIERDDDTPENAPANNNCASFEVGSSSNECISNCKAADCEINYNGGGTWCKPWCVTHFNPDLPQGDYLSFCDDCKVDKDANILSCKCRSRYGSKETSLDLNTCRDSKYMHVMYHPSGMLSC